MDFSEEVAARARKIRFVILDVDGVLTDGRLTMCSDGSESKTFHTHDGHGIRMAQRGGLSFGIISGRKSEVVTERARELGITEVHQRIFDKSERLDELLSRLELDEEAVCYIGDDLVDLPVMRRVGLAVAPANARPEVRETAHFVTRLAGGRGAVREAVELLMRARGDWNDLIEKYF